MTKYLISFPSAAMDVDVEDLQVRAFRYDPAT